MKAIAKKIYETIEILRNAGFKSATLYTVDNNLKMTAMQEDNRKNPQDYVGRGDLNLKNFTVHFGLARAVDVLKLTPDNLPEVVNFIGDLSRFEIIDKDYYCGMETFKEIKINTLLGLQTAKFGDYIVRDYDNQFHVFADSDFSKEYQLL